VYDEILVKIKADIAIGEAKYREIRRIQDGG